MKAIVFDKIGLPSDVLELRDVPIPEIRDNEVLVKISAWDLLELSQVRAGQWLLRNGELYADYHTAHIWRSRGTRTPGS